MRACFPAFLVSLALVSDQSSNFSMHPDQMSFTQPLAWFLHLPCTSIHWALSPYCPKSEPIFPSSESPQFPYCVCQVPTKKHLYNNFQGGQVSFGSCFRDGSWLSVSHCFRACGGEAHMTPHGRARQPRIRESQEGAGNPMYPPRIYLQWPNFLPWSHIS